MTERWLRVVAIVDALVLGVALPARGAGLAEAQPDAAVGASLAVGLTFAVGRAVGVVGNQYVSDDRPS